jgi:hypothetical protein
MKKALSIIILFTLFFSSCVEKHSGSRIHIQRMEHDLFECKPESLKDSVPMLYKKYDAFFRIFTEGIINVGDSSNPTFNEYLKNFITNYGIYLSYQKSKEVFPDMNDYEKSLGNAFNEYLKKIPGEKTPHVYSFISGYLQGVAALDTIVGIGLDMYLGRDFEPYSIMWPDKKYKRYNLHKNKIPTDVIQCWAMSKYPFASEENTVLANMLYFGKIWYFSKMIMPEESDTLIYGFSPLQLKWCNNNEEQMWTYLVEHKMLYNTDYLVINKFVADGPFTQYFTNESPAKATVWVGYRIIESFMKRNPTISLKQLMNDNEYQKILSMSGYKP